MKLSATDYNVLSYLLKENKIPYELLLEWAYGCYTDQGVDEFVEKIALSYDLAEVIELISNTYQVYGRPSDEFLIGEAAHRYEAGELSLHSAIDIVLYRLDVELPEAESQELYIADDYFGWHKTPEKMAVKHAEPVFNRYLAAYRMQVGKFCV